MVRNRCRIPGMAGRAVNVTARILLFLSGVAAGLLAALYALLRGSDLPRQSEWVIFTAVFGLLGVANLLAAIFPASWTARIWRIADRSSLFSLPLRMFGVFAVISYLLTVGFFLTPHQWNLSGFLGAYLLCPVYIVRESYDPRALELFLMLAPIDAAGWGAVGSVVGFLLGARKKTAPLEGAPVEGHVGDTAE